MGKSESITLKSPRHRHSHCAHISVSNIVGATCPEGFCGIIPWTP